MYGCMYGRMDVLPCMLYNYTSKSEAFWGYLWFPDDFVLMYFVYTDEFVSSIPSVCGLNTIPLMENVISCLISDATSVDLLRSLPERVSRAVVYLIK